MGLLREFYRRLMGNDGWVQIGQVALAVVLVVLLLGVREVFGGEDLLILLGTIVVFFAGFYAGDWCERRRISENYGLDIKRWY
jgi:hypothetical protein